MEYSIFISSVLLLFIPIYSTPGPNNAIVMAVALSRGFLPALPHCLAVGASSALILFLVGMGLGEVFTHYPILQEILRYVGAAYMLWLAWRIAGFDGKGGPKLPKLANAEDPSSPNTSAGPKPLSFFQGIAFQFVNPKAWLAIISAVTSYAGKDEYVFERVLIMTALIALVGFITACIWSAGGVFMAKFLSAKGMRRCNYVFASFLLLSVITLFVQK